MTNDVFIDHLYTFFGEMSFQILCQFFSWVIFLFIFELYEFFIYYRHKSFIRQPTDFDKGAKAFLWQKDGFSADGVGATGHPEAPEV